MIEDKLKESEFFLNKLKEECDKKSDDHKTLYAISCYYSAFLTASYSIFDYALHDANKVFGLKLDEETYWNWRTFEKESKLQKNEKAMTYFEWWSNRLEIENGMTVGKAFARCRRINTHKRQTYTIGVDPEIISDSPKSDDRGRVTISLEVKPNIFLKVEGFTQMKIDDACATYYSTLEKFVLDHKKKIQDIQE